MPPGLKPTLGVFQAALELTSQCELHPDLVSQTFGYLFFFSNASLLNSLMERGEGWTGKGLGGRDRNHWDLRQLRHITGSGLILRDSRERGPDPKLKDRKGLGGRRAGSMDPLLLIPFPHRSRPTILSMVPSCPNPNQPGSCLGLAAGGWAGWHCHWVLPETLHSCEPALCASHLPAQGDSRPLISESPTPLTHSLYSAYPSISPWALCYSQPQLRHHRCCISS